VAKAGPIRDHWRGVGAGRGREGRKRKRKEKQQAIEVVAAIRWCGAKI
jgi:hypothetical protein